MQLSSSLLLALIAIFILSVIVIRLLHVKNNIHNSSKKLEDQLTYLAYHDTLTGLANREQFSREFNHALTIANQEKSQLAVLFLDVNQFKWVNDAMGHEMGDLLLQQIAKRLMSVLRPQDIVCRFGGDEFVIVVEKIIDIAAVEKIAEKLLQVIKEPMVIDKHNLFVTASIGISMYPEDGDNEKVLLNNADIAMYRAKQVGENTYKLFMPEMKKTIAARISLENDIRLALNKNAFTLYYQPQIDISSGKIASVEALIRLPRADSSLLSPAEFIPVAEESGLIIPLGEWALETACQQRKQWHDKNFQELTIAINVSAHQFKEVNLVANIKNMLTKYSIDPCWIELEITETAVMQNIDHSINMIAELKNLGIQIALDDFGSGYSSLNLLKQLNIDVIKIDQLFIQHLPGDKKTAAIVAAIINMAHALDIAIVAEGIESMEQIEFLLACRCDKVQGNYFSKSISAEAMTALLLNARYFKLSA